ncbi:MAG: phosphoenolpyruvate hydrolase family protein [Verrucomicrobia bacterium]|nr:phosphoenolpyruvate hydrolase family protein [Verrucomicrobiota bacterium]
MKLSPAALKTRLLRKSEAGEAIQFRRITCALATSPEDLASADLLLLDHTSASPGFHPAAELLPLDNANAKVLHNAELYRELIERYPVVAGLCGTDPFRIPSKLLHQIKELGFIGVQNWPSVGLIDGAFRAHLEHSHISYDQEVAMLNQAKELGLLVVGTGFSEQDAQKMSAIDVDVMVVHPGPGALVSGHIDLAKTSSLLKNVVGVMSASNTIVLPASVKHLCLSS